MVQLGGGAGAGVGAAPAGALSGGGGGAAAGSEGGGVGAGSAEGAGVEGPIDVGSDIGAVRAEPYRLPDAFEWCTCDVSDEGELAELHTLLNEHYVEDDDGMFRFNYQKEFLRWALQPPGYHREWHVGIRVVASRRLVAFISGIPATLRATCATADMGGDGAAQTPGPGASGVPMAEINFLCIHKKLRSKRLAPVLIKEVTRRVNLEGVWQAAYTAGIVIPTPVASCQYWHRSINVRKLIDVGFSKLPHNMTMKSQLRLYRLPEQTATSGLRPMEPADVPGVLLLLRRHLSEYGIAPAFQSEDEVAHWLLPREGVLHSFVRAEGADGEVTDLISFYSLPSSVLHHPKHQDLLAAYAYYNIASSVPLPQLLQDALILARDRDFDVFNALDLMQNSGVLQNLKFGIGDGCLQYYLYNWKLARKLEPSEVGLVML